MMNFLSGYLNRLVSCEIPIHYHIQKNWFEGISFKERFWEKFYWVFLEVEDLQGQTYFLTFQDL